MLVETGEAILVELQKINDLKTIDHFDGDLEELLEKAVHVMPSAHLIYGGCKFQDKENIGSNMAQNDAVWSVILMTKSTRSRRDAAVQAYGLIEDVRAKLIGFETGYGWLWPITEALVSTKGGLRVYGLDYGIETETEDT